MSTINVGELIASFKLLVDRSAETQLGGIASSLATLARDSEVTEKAFNKAFGSMLSKEIKARTSEIENLSSAMSRMADRSMVMRQNRDARGRFTGGSSLVSNAPALTASDRLKVEKDFDNAIIENAMRRNAYLRKIEQAHNNAIIEDRRRTQQALQSLEKMQGQALEMNKTFDTRRAKLWEQELRGTTRKAQGFFDEMADRFANRIKFMIAQWGVFAATIGTVGLIWGAIKASFDYLSTIETASLGIASSFMSNGKFVDQVTGKVVEGHRALQGAQEMSTITLEHLQVANFKTIATLDQLIRVYQETLPVAMAKGFNPNQVEQFTVAVVQAAGAIGLSMDMLGEETRSLLTGAINTRTSRVAQVLGLRPADITQFKGDATGLFNFLMERLKAYSIAGEESMKTWAGIWSNIKDLGKMVGGNLFGGMFDATKKFFSDIISSIVTLDEKTKTLKWNPAFIEGLETMKYLLSTFWDLLSSIPSGAIDFFVEYNKQIQEANKNTEDFQKRISERTDWDNLVKISVDAGHALIFVFKTIGSTAAWLLGSVFTILKSLAMAIYDTFGNLGELLVGIFTLDIQKIKNVQPLLQPAMDRLQNSFKDLDTGTEAYFNSIGNNYEAMVKKMVGVDLVEPMKKSGTAWVQNPAKPGTDTNKKEDGAIRAFLEQLAKFREEVERSNPELDTFEKKLQKVKDRFQDFTRQAINNPNLPPSVIPFGEIAKLQNIEAYNMQVEHYTKLLDARDAYEEQYLASTEVGLEKELSLLESKFMKEMLANKNNIYMQESIQQKYMLEYYRTIDTFGQKELASRQESLAGALAAFQKYTEATQRYGETEMEFNIRRNGLYQKFLPILEMAKKGFQDMGAEGADGLLAINAEMEKLTLFFAQVAEYQMSFTDGIANGFKKIADQAKTSFQQGEQVAQDVAGAMTNAFEGFFDVTSDKFMNFKQFALDILNDIYKALLKTLVLQPLINSISGGISGMFGGGGIGAGGGANIGGPNAGGFGFDLGSGGGISSVLGFHNGGLVMHGGGLASDERSATLQTGERVMSRKQARMFEQLSQNSGTPEVTINIENSSSQPVNAKQGKTEFDGKKYITSIILEDLNNYGSIHKAMKGQGMK